jgi:methanol metabolism-related c-type cytochrome
MTTTRWAAILAGAALAAAVGTAPARAQDEEKPYEVVDGKVDPGTYNGYRRYHASCHTCHGPDGLGSSYAPSLVDSLKNMNQEQFNEIVINGRQNVGTGTQQQNVMPAFGEVVDVASYIQDIYAYLKARSDGVLKRGRPKKLDTASSG